MLPDIVEPRPSASRRQDTAAATFAPPAPYTVDDHEVEEPTLSRRGTRIRPAGGRIRAPNRECVNGVLTGSMARGSGLLNRNGIVRVATEDVSIFVEL